VYVLVAIVVEGQPGSRPVGKLKLGPSFR
jgi:hypothetical protein